MAYNNYFPASYQPMYYQPQYQPPQPVQPMQQTQAPQTAGSFAAGQQGSGLIWVQGEAGAKSYLVAPNTTVMLMDSESEQFFLKSADASGMPLPLRVFRYSEISKTANKAPEITPMVNNTEYALKSELEALRGRLEAFMSGGEVAGKHEKEVAANE